MELVFTNPEFLVLLLFIPLVIFSHYYVLRFSRKRGIPFANYDTLARISGKYVFSQNNVQLLYRVFIIVSLVFAIAGLGFFTPTSVPPGRIHFLLDASESMFIGQNSFIESTGFLLSIPQVSFLTTGKGISLFSTYSQILQAPTINARSFYEAIASAQKHGVSGTDYGTALLNGISLLNSDLGSKRLVLITDGSGFFGTGSEVIFDEAKKTGTVIDVILTRNFKEGSAKSSIENIVEATKGQVFYLGQTPDAQIITQLHSADEVNFFSLQPFLIILTLLLLVLDWMFSKTFFKVIPYETK